MIQEFYAVTKTSVYHVEAHGEYRSSAKKIANKGKSAIPVGSDLGENHFYMIGVGYCLFSYIPEKHGATHPMTGFERNFECINTRYWGYVSSNVVALFKSEEEAKRCLKSEDLQPRDQRWIASTNEILEAIGDDHPSFFVSHSKHFGLLEIEYEAA